MKESKKGRIRNVLDVTRQFSSHHTSAYAAQAAYFFLLSLIPIIILLLTLVQFTPVTEEDVMQAVLQVFPSSVEGLIAMLVTQVYNQSGSIIPFTILMALWSAGKGVLSMTSGLNCVYENTETRNYIFLRIRASIYMVIFILAIVLSLSLSVFGNSISLFINEHVPLLRHVTDLIIRIRTLLILGVLTMKKQLPGAVFTACGWQLISFVFSIYLDVFTGFSTMYGSLTTIILILLWFYMCMYVILLGGEINALLERYEDQGIPVG